MSFKGSGGGGPSNSRDSLFSTDAFEFVLGISEGPIWGIDGDTIEEKLQNIFIDDTAVFSTTGESNFKDSNLFIRFEQGTDLTSIDDPDAGQTPIMYVFNGATVSEPVNLSLSSLAPVTKVTSKTPDGYDQIELRFFVSQLVRYTDDGNRPSNITVRIQSREVGTPDWESTNLEIEGKTTVNGFVKTLVLNVPRGDSNTQHELRVTVLTEDSNDDRTAEIAWASYELVKHMGNAYQKALPDYTNENFEYHAGNSMLHMAGVLGQQLNNLPNVNAIYKGLLCAVPSNYDPMTKTYDEANAWDGTFSPEKQWTDNPFWIVHELITNIRFGAAKYNPLIRVNRFSVYEKAKYADGYNPISGVKDLYDPILNINGAARYTYNAIITDSQQGMGVINQILASAFSIAVDNDDGEIQIYADMPSVPTITIMPEMCMSPEGGTPFSYTFSDITSRHNAVTAKYIDKENKYQPQVLSEIRDEDSISKHGYNRFEFDAVGTTSAWEADRKRFLFMRTVQTETKTITFTMPMLGYYMEVFDVIAVVDPDMGNAMSGRCVELGAETIRVRDPLYFAQAGTYNVTLQGFDQDYYFQTNIDLEDEMVPLTEFTVVGTMPNAADLSEYPIVYIENSESTPTSSVGIPKLYRIASIDESEDVANSYQITATEVNPNKHSDADLMVNTPVPQYSFLNEGILQKVTGLQVIKQEVLETDTGVKYNLIVSWDEQTQKKLGTTYEVQVQSYEQNAGVRNISTPVNYVEIEDVGLGQVVISVKTRAGDTVTAAARVDWFVSRIGIQDFIDANLSISTLGNLSKYVFSVSLNLPYTYETSRVGNLLKEDPSLVGYIRVFDTTVPESPRLILEDSSVDGRFNYSSGEFKQFMGQVDYVPTNLTVYAHLKDSSGARFPVLEADETPYVIGVANGDILNLTLQIQDSDLEHYKFDWDDTHYGYIVNVLGTNINNVLSTRTIYENTFALSSLSDGKGYRLSVQGFDENQNYSRTAYIIYANQSTITNPAAPTVDIENGVIRTTPVKLDKPTDRYQFKHGVVNDLAQAKDGPDGSSLVIPNTKKGETNYVWYRKKSVEGLGDWVQTTAIADEQPLYDWKAYADDEAGANISLTKGARTYVGISAGHTNSSADISDPSIYTWIPIIEGVDWLTGSGAPNGGLGRLKSKYLDLPTGDVYVKTGASAWTLEGNLKGDDGDKWFTGTDNPPSNTFGKDGDNYLVTGVGRHYQKVGGSWSFAGLLKGADGTSVTVSGSSINSNGDTVVNFSDGSSTTISRGIDGESEGVKAIYATNSSGSSASFTEGSREFINLYEWAGTAPTSVPTGLTYSRFKGVKGDTGIASGVVPVYATNTTGTSASFTRGSRTHVNFYEWTGTKPSTVPSGLSYLKIVGEDGERGAGHYYATGASWNNTTANNAIPDANKLGDRVTISNGSTFSETRAWNNSAWVTVSAFIDGNLLVNGDAIADKVFANTIAVTNSITAEKGDTYVHLSAVDDYPIQVSQANQIIFAVKDGSGVLDGEIITPRSIQASALTQDAIDFIRGSLGIPTAATGGAVDVRFAFSSTLQGQVALISNFAHGANSTTASATFSYLRTSLTSEPTQAQRRVTLQIQRAPAGTTSWSALKTSVEELDYYTQTKSNGAVIRTVSGSVEVTFTDNVTAGDYDYRLVTSSTGSVFGANASGTFSVTETATGGATSSAEANNSKITIETGAGLSGGGNFDLNQNFNETITINHGSSAAVQSKGDNSLKVINRIQRDTHGHVKDTISEIDLAAYLGRLGVNNTWTGTNTFGSGLVILDNTQLSSMASGELQVTTPNGYIEIGAKNSSWTHIYSDKRFYFNQDILVNGNIVDPRNIADDRYYKTTDTVANASNSNLLAGLQAGHFVRTDSAERANPDSYRDSSSYRYAPHTNNPTNSYYAISTYGNGNNVVGQNAIHFVSGENFTRAYNSTWSPWRKQWDDTNHGADSTTHDARYYKLTDTVSKVNISSPFIGTYPMVVNAGGLLYDHPNVTFTGSTGTLTTPIFKGRLEGTADNVNRSISGSNGLTGGGTLTANRTISAVTTGSVFHLAASSGRVVSDCNAAQFRESGMYGFSNVPVNGTGKSYSAMIVARNSDVGLQIAGGYSNDELYFRGWSNSGNTYYAWRRLLHNGNYTSFVTKSYVDGLGVHATSVTNGVYTSRTISTGTGLSGGGNLSANRTLTVDSTVMRNNSTQRITKAAHAANADAYHLELYSGDSGSSEEVSLRMHQGNRFFGQMRLRSDGFHFTQGNSGSYRNIYFDTAYGALSGNAATASALTAGNKTITGDLSVTSNIYASGTGIWGDSKEMFRYSDGWLRLNPVNAFTSGIYCASSIIRTDSEIQVGSGGSGFRATSTITYLKQNTYLSAGKILYFDGGSNTYVREVSADQIQFVTGGVERLRVSTTGAKVSNGTSEATLDVNSGTTTFRLFVRQSDNQMGFYINGATRMRYTGSNNTFNYYSPIVSTSTISGTDVTATSALKYKNITERVSSKNSLDIVLAIGSKGTAIGTFKKGDTEQLHRWFVADEVNEVIPEVVHKKDGEVESLNYNEMLADAYGAIVELNKRIEQLEKPWYTKLWEKLNG